MKINFSADITDIQSDLDTLFPTMGTEQGVKSLLFSKLFNNAKVTPVRYLSYYQSGNDLTLLLDVPAVNSVGVIAGDVLPFTAEAA
jgi:hypothetical protein